jgi:hypothetical protein
MKRACMMILMAMGMLMCDMNASAQGNYVINQQVTIPFAPPVVGQPRRQQLPLPVGDYIVRLTVERADWDRNPNSVAEMVNIGGAYLVQDRQTGRDIDKSNWMTRNGWLAWQITVRPNSNVFIFYSTIAPGGAAGRLTVEAIR